MIRSKKEEPSWALDSSAPNFQALMKESDVTGLPSEKVQPGLRVIVKCWLSSLSMEEATSLMTLPSLS